MYPVARPFRPNPSSDVTLAAGIGIGSALVVGTMRYLFAPSPFTWKTAAGAAGIGAVVGGGAYWLRRFPLAATA